MPTRKRQCVFSNWLCYTYLKTLERAECMPSWLCVFSFELNYESKHVVCFSLIYIVLIRKSPSQLITLYHSLKLKLVITQSKISLHSNHHKTP